jgi:ADP-ribose pyrophosphatase
MRTSDLRPRTSANYLPPDGGEGEKSEVPKSEVVPVFYIVCMPKSPARPPRRKRRKERLISSRTVYRGPVFSVTTDHVEEPNGVRARRDVVHHSGSIVVLAVDDSTSVRRILLERQYRHAATDYLWELPAGRIDPGEQELHAAKRELLEETGYTATHWKRILKFYASPGFVAETMAVYLATGLRAGKAQPEDDEVIYKRLVPLPAAVRMVIGGTIRDAKTISSVLWLDHMSRTTKPKKGQSARRAR